MPFTSKNASKPRSAPSNRAQPRWHQPLLDFGSAEMPPAVESIEVPQDIFPRTRSQSTLFDFLDVEEKTESNCRNVSQSSHVADRSPAITSTEIESKDLADCRKPKSVGIASGERAKARDILTAIRVLSAIENAGRSATDEEREIVLAQSSSGICKPGFVSSPTVGNTSHFRHANREDG
jgi:hypothetical protein